MKAKQEYIDALRRMEGVYYNFDGCMSSMNKFKEDYIGQVGNIVHQQNICVLVGTTGYLYDIEFNDGARFCVDREQIEFVGENE